MKWIFIGHRGVGKTSVLRALQKLRPPSLCFDLDEEIERKEQKNIADVFRDFGEEAFRELEKQTFQNLTHELNQRSECFLAVGAGFPFVEIELPTDWRRVWIQRRSDESGRIFLDRPRLDPADTPLGEFRARKKKRDEVYALTAEEILLLPEGDFHLESYLEKYFEEFCRVAGAGLTLLPRHTSQPLRLIPDFIELRTDYFSEEKIKEIASGIGAKNRPLISFRGSRPAKIFLDWIQENKIAFDWPAELGDMPAEILRSKNQGLVLSAHGLLLKDFLIYAEQTERSERAFFKNNQVHWKFCPTIESFTELADGFRWQQMDPERRSFLPRSSNGRWKWFRLFMKGKQKIHFFCDGEGSAMEQPSVIEWNAMHPQAASFYAVIGHPVELSWSPSFHRDWAHARQSDFFAIDVSPAEVMQNVIPTLQKWGCRGLAVTSPLKKRIVDYYGNFRPAAIHGNADAVNTVLHGENGAQLTNTDEAGLRQLWQMARAQLGEPQAEVVVWGGGGTLDVIARVIPEAIFYSSRTGEPRSPDSSRQTGMGCVVIWAASPAANLPPPDWKAKLVVDLNYREDSRAREYSLQQGAPYFSGETMFIVQALGQQKFWERDITL